MSSMTKKKRIILISVSVVTVLAVVAGVLLGVVFFPPIPKNLPIGISQDKRVASGVKGAEAMFYKSEDGSVLPFLITKPQNIEANKQYPLIIFLQGNTSQGTDNRKQFSRQLDDGLKKYGEDCFVIYPQIPHNGIEYRWDDYLGKEYNYSFMLDRLVEYAFLDGTTYPIDTARIYLVGVSMGAWGVSYQVPPHPDRYSAVAVVMGGKTGDEPFDVWTNIPVWIAHSKDDNQVPYKYGEAFANGIIEAGGTKVIFDVYEKKGHNVQSVLFDNEAFYKWLFSKTRA